MVDMLTKAALQLGEGARSVILSLCEVCGGAGQKIRSRLRRAKPACGRRPPLLGYRTSVMVYEASSEP
jgi:hypothetical protein